MKPVKYFLILIAIPGLSFCASADDSSDRDTTNSTGEESATESGESRDVILGNKESCIEGDCQSGEGAFIWKTGAKYIGNFKDGKRNGVGTFTWPGGSNYTGNWQDGKRQGKGTYIWRNGDKYTGEFHNDQRHGMGVYMFKNGKSLPGQWANGLPQR